MLCFLRNYDTINVMRTLRIIFCILACASVAAVVPVAVFFEYYCLIPIGTAFLFGFAMFAAKRAAAPKRPQPSFMNSDEENARINEMGGKDKDE